MPPIPNEANLSARAQNLLKLLIERYIQEGQPVGSRTLARDSGLDLSPATIRNVMSDLEELGLIKSPHTSAGRVPTVPGYRFFVDSLLTVKPLHSDEVCRLQAQLDPEQQEPGLIKVVSNLLSEVTHLAGIVTIPRQPELRLRQVEFLHLSDNQVLVILVINEMEVQNRVIRTQRRYSPSQLQQAANYLNEICAGKDLSMAREHLLNDMQATRERMNHLMMAAIEIADKAFSAGHAQDDFVLAGETNLMEYGELADMEKLRQLFEAFNHKRDILHLLDNSLRAHGVQIFIGEESGHEVLDDCSVVASSYESDGQPMGVLGVIGPTRMAYERVIPLVDLTARLLGAALNQRQ